MPQPVIGCDLSRAFLDLCALPSGQTLKIANTPDAIAAFVADLEADTLVVCGATSGCDGDLIAALAEHGQPFCRVNPRQAREFARATGVLAKTDRVDARVLAKMGRTLNLPVTVPVSAARAQPSDLLRRRRQLIELLGGQIMQIDRRIAGLITADHTLSTQASLLAAVPGIGPTVLAPCSAHCPNWERSAVAASLLSQALRPMPGKTARGAGARRIWGGRRKVRQALYIAALSTSRRIPSLTAKPDRMRLKGKAPKTILIAGARQLLVILNAMIRKSTPIAIA